MSEDVIEMPEHRCLFRQSSVEVHLTPEPPEFSDSEDEDMTTPKIVAEIEKSPEIRKPMGINTDMMDELKNKFEKNKFHRNDDTPKSGNRMQNRPEIPIRNTPQTSQGGVLYTEITTKPSTANKHTEQSNDNDSCMYAEIIQKQNPDIATQNKSMQSEIAEKLKNLQLKPSIPRKPNQQKVTFVGDMHDDGQNVNPIYEEVQKSPAVAHLNIPDKPSGIPAYAQVIKKTKSSNLATEMPKTASVYENVMPSNMKNEINETIPSRDLAKDKTKPEVYENVMPSKFGDVNEKMTSDDSKPVPTETLMSKDIGDIKAFDTAGKMATLRPKSPRPPVVKPEKEESLWDKLGTLGRKKRIKEVKEVEAEGKNAIDSPGFPVTPDYPPEEYELDENEERCMVNLPSLEQPKVKDLIQILMDWINDELAEQRIIVQDIVEDLYDGQVLQKLLERLTGDKLNEPEVTQSEAGQKHKLAMVLEDFNRVLGLQHQAPKKWGVEAIHSKNIVAILYLLVALARHFRAPIRLPEHVTIVTHVVQKSKGQLIHRTVHEHVTSAYDDVGMRCERDAFDTLFDHAPDKLQVVKKSMVTFVNKHLNKINLEVTDLDTQFSDGVYLVLLMGLLEGFFVPLHCFFLTPKDFDQKVHNVAFAFELMEEVGISRPKARPEDIVNLDLKSTLRVLYKLFTKYRDIM